MNYEVTPTGKLLSGLAITRGETGPQILLGDRYSNFTPEPVALSSELVAEVDKFQRQLLGPAEPRLYNCQIERQNGRLVATPPTEDSAASIWVLCNYTDIQIQTQRTISASVRGSGALILCEAQANYAHRVVGMGSPMISGKYRRQTVLAKLTVGDELLIENFGSKLTWSGMKEYRNVLARLVAQPYGLLKTEAWVAQSLYVA